MSSEIHKNIKSFSEKQKVLFDADVINFSKGSDTSSVTSGKGETETINYLDNHFFKIKNKDINLVFPNRIF